MTAKKIENKEPWKDYTVAVPIDVRYRDLDTNNHVTNSVYFNYFEQGRVALFHQVPTFKEAFETNIGEKGFTSVLVHTEAQFKAQAFLNQELICAARIIAIRKVFIDSEYVVFDKKTGAKIATGKAVNIMVALDGYKPMRLPKEIVAEMEEVEGRKLS